MDGVIIYNVTHFAHYILYYLLSQERIENLQQHLEITLSIYAINKVALYKHILFTT